MTELRATEGDSLELMRQLSRIANVEWGKFRRVVLVLDVDDVPRLYTELLLQVSEEQLGDGITEPIVVEEKKLPIIDTSTMQNEKWRTHHRVQR